MDKNTNSHKFLHSRSALTEFSRENFDENNSDSLFSKLFNKVNLVLNNNVNSYPESTFASIAEEASTSVQNTSISSSSGETSTPPSVRLEFINFKQY